MENLWPSIDGIRKTEEVMNFFKETTETIKQNYGGKIESKLTKIEFVLKRKTRSLESMHNEMRILTAPIPAKDEYEEKKEVEIGRDSVVVKCDNYKYEIYNNHLYYKIFNVKIPEFYPVTITASAGILDKDEKDVIINDLDELKNTFLNIVCSDKIRMIIKKMMM